MGRASGMSWIAAAVPGYLRQHSQQRTIGHVRYSIASRSHWSCQSSYGISRQSANPTSKVWHILGLVHLLGAKGQPKSWRMDLIRTNDVKLTAEAVWDPQTPLDLPLGEKGTTASWNQKLLHLLLFFSFIIPDVFEYKAEQMQIVICRCDRGDPRRYIGCGSCPLGQRQYP